jgi:hypothetical protein
MLSACDTAAIAHWWTWTEYEAGWTAALKVRLSIQPDLQTVTRRGRKIVMLALKECRICLYRQAG